MEFKNYYIQFLDGTQKRLTAKQAYGIGLAIQNGLKVGIIDGEMYAFHQVKAVKRLARDEERYLAENAGLIELNAPEEKLNQLLADNSMEAVGKAQNNNLSLI